MLRFFKNDPKFNRYDNFRVEVGLHSTSFKKKLLYHNAKEKHTYYSAAKAARNHECKKN